LLPLYSGEACLARSEASASAGSTPGQARAADSGGKPPHSTYAEVTSALAKWRKLAKVVCRAQHAAPLQTLLSQAGGRVARYQGFDGTEVPPNRATPVLPECDFASTVPTACALLLFPFGHARKD
jgi:hypothetical protein